MALDLPPQTIAEALEFGWTHLSIDCPSCNHTGRIELSSRESRQPQLLAALFAKVKCSRCGLFPTTAKLAAPFTVSARQCWHEKRVDFYEGRVIRPSRE